MLVTDELQLGITRGVIQLQDCSQPLIIQGDPIRLEQVFQNLIYNAVKYSQPSEPVYVEVAQHGPQICVEVRDTGIGIPPAALPRVFERFYRAENVDQANISGLGIGLYVVKEIVELHGGQVTTQSAEGIGSTFTVCFPCDAV
jgi:signal transduction histidine kinase